ncbi:MAG: hypothetical protein MH252_05915 [Thermosynechococcaceae cyanobacterium MS004]|nr:hypothetical protein [Thermosynechococcaceae cyanobacterium MS004]
MEPNNQPNPDPLMSPELTQPELTQPKESAEAAESSDSLDEIGLDELGRSLQEAEELLSHVKARFAQVKSAQVQRTDLESRLSELNTEIETVKSQLAATWEDLESQLITWRDKQELFWQFLRFSGIGFGLALLLNFLIKQ